MSEYLSKEEIKQWRSSLEKITLEEFAARLGKKVEEKKSTNDLVDLVLHGRPVVSEEPEYKNSRVERLSAIADRAYEKEKKLYASPFSAKNLKTDQNKPVKKGVKKALSAVEKVEHAAKKAKNTPQKAGSVNQKPEVSKAVTTKTEHKKQEQQEALQNIIEDTNTGDKLRDEVRIVFKKALTDREQKVFDYFASHKNNIVYAKDLAELLELPRDYVYKYIKNLRAKIEGEALQNADKGGFILNV